MTQFKQVHVQRYPLPDSAHAAKFCDTMDIDQGRHRLYAGDNWSGGVDVFDISTAEPEYLTTVRIRGNLFGIAVAADLNKLFVGLANSSVGVIDIDPASPTLHTVTARIDTDGRGACDLLDYDPVHRKVYVANRNLVNGVDNGFLTAIDAISTAIVGRINGLGRTLEQPRFNRGDGMVYVAGAGENVLYQVDPVTDTLVNTFSIPDDCHPNGLAINWDTDQALLACNTPSHPHTVIWDLRRQHIASVIEESGAGDGAIYDPVADRFFFAASGFGGGPVMGVFGGNPVRFLTNVTTQRGASWVAYDETNELVYAPAYADGKPALIAFPLPDE